MRLNQVTIPALDLDRSIAFYEALGLKLIVKSPHYARFEVGDDGATLSLQVANEPIGNGAHIYLECEDLDDLVAKLKERGIAFEDDPADKRWLWREAWLRDPSGVKLCLYWAGQMRRFPPWRLPD